MTDSPAGAFEGQAANLAVKRLVSDRTREALLALNPDLFRRPEDLVSHLKNLVALRGRVVALEFRREGTWKRVGDSDVEISKEVALRLLGTGNYFTQIRKEMFGHIRGASLLEQDANLALLFGDFVALAAFFHEIGAEALIRTFGDVAGRAEGTRSIRLNPVQTRLIREHPEKGAREIRLRPVSDMVQDHHERWDGKGYPRGAAGENLTLGGRIIALCGAVQAIVNWRSYDVAHPGWFAVEEVKRCSGMEFDREKVQKYLREEAFTKAAAELSKRALGTEGGRSQFRDELAFLREKYLVDLPEPECLSHPRLSKNLQFDPRVAEAFLELYEEELLA